MKDKLESALDAASDGYAPDRVVADPEMNAKFLFECSRLGLSESPTKLNHALLNLRKSGQLLGRKSKRTSFANQKDYVFAAEMAVRFLERRDEVSLDDIICDPARASEFDCLVAELAPGYSPLQYRWAALSLRKASRLKPEIISKVIRPMSVTHCRTDYLTLNDIAGQQGLYLFYTNSVTLYVGESENLRNRIAKHLDHSDNKELARWFWQYGQESVHLELQVLPAETPVKHRRALESELIRSRSPIFNVKR